MVAFRETNGSDSRSLLSPLTALPYLTLRPIRTLSTATLVWAATSTLKAALPSFLRFSISLGTYHRKPIGGTRRERYKS